MTEIAAFLFPNHCNSTSNTKFGFFLEFNLLNLQFAFQEQKSSRCFLQKAALGFLSGSARAGKEGAAPACRLPTLLAVGSLPGSAFGCSIWIFPRLIWSSGVKHYAVWTQARLLIPVPLSFSSGDVALCSSVRGFLSKARSAGAQNWFLIFDRFL